MFTVPYLLLCWSSFKILDNFPEATKTIYFTNAPWFMKFALGLIKPLLPAATRKKLSVQTIMWLDKRKKRISEIIQKLKQREYSSLAESRIEQLNLSLASINQKLFLEFKWHDKFMEEVYSQLPYFDYE